MVTIKTAEQNAARGTPAQRETRGLRLKSTSLKGLEAGQHHDGQGLYLVIGEAGSDGQRARSWVLRYKVRGGRRFRMGLGSYPLVTLAEARIRATDNRRIADSGVAPVAAKRAGQLATVTFRHAAEEMHIEKADNFRNDRHRAQRIGTLKEFAYPVIGSMAVAGITSGDIKRMLMKKVSPEVKSTDKNGRERTYKRKVKGPFWTALPVTAARVLERTGEVLAWARTTYDLKMSPLEEIAAVKQALGKPQATGKHMPAMAHADVFSFIVGLRQSGATAAVRLALEFLILTALRTKPVRLAVWGEIDEANATWTIPGNKMKATRREHAREHRVPLSERCLEILQEARALGPCGAADLIFPSATPRNGKQARLGDMTLITLLRRRGLDVSVHGFRSTFRDWAAEISGHHHDVCEQALAHRLKDATEAAYTRTDLFDKRKALMNDWARYCTTKTAASNVVPMRKQA